MNGMGTSGPEIKFPHQKRSTAEKYKKDKQFFKDCVQGAEDMALYYERETHRKMEVWKNLDDDIIDVEEIEKVFNPMELEHASFPATTKNFPIGTPKLDLLQGEEANRQFEFSVKGRSNDASTNEGKDVMEMFMQILLEETQQKGYDEEKFQSRVEEFSKYVKYEWKDAYELAATRILQYLWRQQDVRLKFNKGFRDALVFGREIYRIEDEGEEPVLVRCDPRNVYLLRKGASEKIEDADIIVEINYEPVGKVIDSFYNYLTPAEVDSIENGHQLGGSNSGNLNHKNSFPPIFSNLDFGQGPGFVDLNDFADNNFKLGLPYDSEGNVRIVRARWKGRKKIGRLTFINQDTGEEEEKIVSEHYKANKALGEKIKWMWVNESMEGTKIGADIFVKLQPRKIQMRHFDNKSISYLGYTGTDYGKSMWSRIEPYQYQYNIYIRKLELLMAKYKGPIYELDLAKVPDEWDMDKWMYYAEVLGWAPVDNFNEAKKGAAMGKLSGAFNTTGKVLDAQMGNNIQQIVMYLSYIEEQVGKVVGVTDQRMGQVQNRETVGGVERSVSQSNHITEKWFFQHDETKKRALNALLDTAKYMWNSNGSKKLSFVLDDLSRVFVEFTPSDIASTEFDIFTSNSGKDAAIRQTIESLIQPAIQNGASLKLAIDVARADSLTQAGKLIEQAEQEAQERAMEQTRAQNEQAEMLAQMQYQREQAERELKIYEIDTKAATELEKTRMIVEGNADDKSESGDDNNDMQKHQDNIALNRDQLLETIRSNKAKEQIARSKPSPSSK